MQEQTGYEPNMLVIAKDLSIIPQAQKAWTPRATLPMTEVVMAFPGRCHDVKAGIVKLVGPTTDKHG